MGAPFLLAAVGHPHPSRHARAGGHPWAPASARATAMAHPRTCSAPEDDGMLGRVTPIGQIAPRGAPSLCSTRRAPSTERTALLRRRAFVGMPAHPHTPAPGTCGPRSPAIQGVAPPRSGCAGGDATRSVSVGLTPLAGAKFVRFVADLGGAPFLIATVGVPPSLPSPAQAGIHGPPLPRGRRDWTAAYVLFIPRSGRKPGSFDCLQFCYRWGTINASGYPVIARGIGL